MLVGFRFYDPFDNGIVISNRQDRLHTFVKLSFHRPFIKGQISVSEKVCAQGTGLRSIKQNTREF